jgi:hypothetical protein
MHDNDSMKTIAQSDPRSSIFGIPRPRLAASPARSTEVAA